MHRMKYKNSYIVEIDNNANAISTPAKTTYCVKCGKKLNENSLDRFCDSECCKEYFAEIRKDIDSLEIQGGIV